MPAVSTQPACGETIRVPSMFATIQEAVESSAPGDTVLVAPGVYDRVWTRTVVKRFEEIEIMTNVLVDRPVVIIGEAGAGATVIKSDGRGPVVMVTGTGGVVLRGFTITGGKIDERTMDGGGGVSCASSNIEISDNIIEGNAGPFGGGVYCSDGATAEIRGNLIRDNTDSEFGAAVALLSGSSGIVEFNVMAENRARVFGGAVFVSDYSFARIRRNTMVANDAVSGSAVLCRSGSDSDVSANIIAFCTGGPAVYCDTLAAEDACTLDLYCNDFWGNRGGDMSGCAWSESNRVSDPLFCSVQSGDFSPCVFSPSIRVTGECGRRGALPSGCSGCEIEDIRLSWGFLKSLYR